MKSARVEVMMWLVVLATGVTSAPSMGFAAGDLRVAELKTEYLVDPMGLAAARPRLSWMLLSRERNLKQAAYQVTAHATTGESWDSGRVETDQSTHVSYAGPPLPPRTRVTWKVRVWDTQGRSAQSPPASFEMGLLAESDWGEALWIGKAATPLPEPVQVDAKAMRWIWHSEPGDPSVKAAIGKRAFRRDFELDFAQPETKRAYFACTADAKAVIWLNAQAAGYCTGAAKLFVLDVARLLVRGKNRLEVLVHNGGGAGGLIGQVFIEHNSRAITRISTDAQWESMVVDAQADRIPATGQWTKAREVARVGEGKEWKDLATSNVRPGHFIPPTYLRREWTLNRKPRHARMYATALGIYEIAINGHRVGDQTFAPGFTNYHHRVQVQTYDVASLLKQGRNVITATLADGWYAGTLGWTGDRNSYGPYPLRLRARLDLLDGAKESLVTDAQWKVTHGPVSFADFYDGERYDARKELTGWERPGFKDDQWDAVDAAKLDKVLTSEPAAAVRVTQELKPQKVTNPRPGEYVFDMGQNMVGWVRLRVRGPAGTTVTLRHGEMLHPDGTLYTENLRDAESTDSYTLSGRGTEVWEPHFTFHGFRYVSLAGFPGRPTKDTIVGRVAHSDIPQTLKFSTDNQLLNQLQSNIDWGQRGNFLSVPTDCPQRDERLGWMGDAQVFARTACLNRDVAAFFTKWLRDVNAVQHEGSFTDIAPTMTPRSPGQGTPGWGDAGVIVPWTMYECYGDRRLLEDSFPHMTAWVDRLARANPDFLWKNKRGSDLGDWLAVRATTDKEVLATAFFGYSTRIASQAAAALGNTEAAERYKVLHANIGRAFTDSYVDKASGKIRGDTQTAYVLALRFGLVPDDLRSKVAQQLIKNLQAHDNHLSTGFIGVSHLLPALSQMGRDDLAYTVLLQTSFPSWLYSINQGATTIWERWDGWTPEKGFQNPAMNSFNHYSFGSVGEWMYENIAGLQPLSPGWKRIRVRPIPGRGLKRATGEMKTPYGTLVSRWTLENQKFNLHVQIPVNTTAEVHVPGKVLDAGVPKGAARGKEAAAGSVFEVGSGTWDFASSM